jgi:hypothetical protein
MKWDWRFDYIICKHVFTDGRNGKKLSWLRCCCDDCHKKGFLESELSVEQINGFNVGIIQD